MNQKIKIFIILLFSFIVFPTVALADEGPKPSIDINIKNLETTNYLIDLFIYDEDGKGYESEKQYGGIGLTEEQISQLYKLNFDGWFSKSTRSHLLFSDCAGNANHRHHFSYFGTPMRYKIVIINNDTNEIKISNEIIRDTLNSKVTIDYNTMNVKSNNYYLKTIIIAIMCLVITVFTELLIAYVFKVKNYKIISITNILTNLGLQVSLIQLFKNYLVTFTIGEILVILIETSIYLIKFKNVSKLKTITYGFVANIATILISFLLHKI